MKTILRILLCFTFAFISACVGTIDKAKEVKTSTVNQSSKISFSGINTGKAIGHDRVKLSFKKASGGSGSFAYRVYVDGNTTVATSVLGTDLVEDSDGLCWLTVKGLSKGTSYTFQMKAYDQVDLAEDLNSVMVSITTTTLIYPVFDGINYLSNVPGSKGTTSLKISWNPASAGETPIVEDPIQGNPYAIAGYHIYIGKTKEELLKNIDDSNFHLPSIDNPEQTSAIIGGLESETNYFIAVRAFDNGNSREDLNTSIKQKATISETAQISFAGIDTQNSSIVTGQAGFSQIRVLWKDGTGPYDHYRIYYTKIPTSGFTPNQAETDPNITTIIVSDVATTNYTLSGLDANSLYYIGVVACKGVLDVSTNTLSCINYAGNTSYLAIQTSPNVSTFGGLTSAVLPAGEPAITSVTLSWSPPDSSSGYWENIEIYSINPSDKDNPPSIPPASSLKKTISSEDGATTWTDINLSPNTEYCYLAKAVISSYLPKRYDSNTRVVCAIPQWTAPAFSGISSFCADIAPTGFTVGWKKPSPLGTFHHYEVFYREGTSLSAKTFFETCVSGDLSCQKKTVLLDTSVSNISLNLTDLTPGTNYQIGVKTYSIAANTRDANLSLVTCTTSKPAIYFQGWFDLMAVGPKIDGRNVTRTVIPEFISPDGKDNYGDDCASSGCMGEVDGIYRHRYPMESNTINNPDGLAQTATNGIVRIAWNDMRLSGSLGLLRDNIGSDASKTGYNIYRMNWMVLHDTLLNKRPPLDNTAGNWGTPLNGNTLIKFRKLLNRNNVPGNNAYYSEWVDYDFDRSSLATNQTRIYFYKIEAVLNGKKLTDFPLYGDEVIMVILPPDNMALVHRWIVNQEMCSLMGKLSDRSTNYRCPYNGLGSSYDPSSASYYYDIGHNALVDRFEAGCNISMADDACMLDGNPRNCAFPNTGSYNNLSATSSSTITWDMTSNIFADTASETTRVSDKGANFNRLSANPMTVMYDANWGYCMINVGSPSSISTYWNYFNGGDVDGRAGNAKEPSVSVMGTKDSIFPSGLGLAKKLYTNNAKLPALNYFSYALSQAACMSSFVKHKGTLHRERLPRLKETIALNAPSPLLDNGTSNTIRPYSVGKLEDGTVQNGKFSTPVSIDRDCNSSSQYRDNTGKDLYSIYFGTASVLDLKYNFANSREYGITGSAVDEYNNISTEACVSRYGIQDVYGSYSKMTSTLVSCHGQKGCFSNKAVHLLATDSINTSSEAPDFDNPWDPESKEELKNSKGIYFEQGYEPYTYAGSPRTLSTATATLDSMSYFLKTLDYNSYAQYANQSALYVSAPLGLRLNCPLEGTRCASDDALFLYSKSPWVNTDFYTEYIQLRGNNGPVPFYSRPMGGAYSGRYSLQRGSYYNNTASFRCFVPIPE